MPVDDLVEDVLEVPDFVLVPDAVSVPVPVALASLVPVPVAEAVSDESVAELDWPAVLRFVASAGSEVAVAVADAVWFVSN